MVSVQAGVLFSQMTPPSDMEPAFNEWYDTEHVPARLALPGFSGAARYRAVQPRSGEYVAVYEVESFDALESPGYAALRARPSERTRQMLSVVTDFTRFTCSVQSDVGQSGPDDLLYVVAFDVPPQGVAAYDEWYEEEHVGMLMAADGWQRVKRLVVREREGAPWTHLTFHYVSSLDVLDSPERAAARVAPLRTRLTKEPWFDRSQRWVYEPVQQGSVEPSNEARTA